jgi:transcriptional regulator with XRE-family HTH domain
MNRNQNFKLASPVQATALIGESLAQFRLSRNLPQTDLALEAGISLSTLKRLERGNNPTLDSLVRVMTALGLAENLSLLIPDTSVRPLERAAAKGHERQRARSARAKRPNGEPWTWDAS